MRPLTRSADVQNFRNERKTEFVLLLLCLTAYVSASVIGCNASSERREEGMLPNSSRFVLGGASPPESPPDVYLVDGNLSPLIRAELFTGDWTGMGGERFEDIPEGRRWPEPQPRGDARVISFESRVPPDFLIVEIYHQFDEEAWEVVPVLEKVEGGELLGPNLTFECVRNMPCFETDNEVSYWYELPIYGAPREVINVYASWSVFPMKFEEPTVGANWRFHFVNEDIDICNWFKQLLRIC